MYISPMGWQQFWQYELTDYAMSLANRVTYTLPDMLLYQQENEFWLGQMTGESVLNPSGIGGSAGNPGFVNNQREQLTAIGAFWHYISGNGEPLKAPFSQLNIETISLTDFKSFRESLISGPGRYVIDDRRSYTESGENFLIFGDVTLRLQGQLKVQRTGWEFNGTLKAYDDHYDFNLSTHRGFWGELSTRVGGYMPGTPYWIEIEGRKSVHAEGDR